MHNIKILMLARSTLYTVPGGDTVQIIETAAAIRKLGISVDIKLADDKVNYDTYDLLHVFNVIRPASIAYHVKRSNKKFVLSTIFVDYSELESKHRGWVMAKLAHLLSSDGLDYLKSLGRLLLNNEKVLDASYFLKGHKKSVENLLNDASILLPNSTSEYNRLKVRYTFNNRFVVVPNAVTNDLLINVNDDEKRDGVLCVARIEALKNQYALIRAINQTNLKLTLVGKPAPNHSKYYQKCVDEAGPNVTFLGHLGKEELMEQYKKHKVHVLPSWFETTGLSSLEAAAMGCNIVVSDKGDTKEYFENYALFCDPGSVASIKSALVKAHAERPDPSFMNKIKTAYTWQKAAEKTVEAYRLALKDDL